MSKIDEYIENGKWGKLVLTSPLVMSLRTFGDIEAYFNFGYGTKFDFKIFPNNMIRLVRNNVDLKVPLKDSMRFKIVEREEE